MNNFLCLGIEGTAEKTGVGVVDDKGKILSSEGKPLIPEKGGIHPREASEHHAEWIPLLIQKAIKNANIELADIDLISFSQGPGLGPALRTVATSARTLSLTLNKPIIGVNHCVAHIEIGKLTTGAHDPVTLYASGGNTQIIAFDNNKYRIFGETLDIALGNMLDQFSRGFNLGHPGGPIIEKLSKKHKSYIKLPYGVKGMDLSFSGLLTAAQRRYEKGDSIEDLAYSLQETAFSMIVEVTERALAHTQKNEVMLCGGVAANSRLREMLQIMSKEHYAEFFMPPMEYCGDNGAMIAWLGQLTYANQGGQSIDDTYIKQKYRTDNVNISWIKYHHKKLISPDNLLAQGAEANIYTSKWINEDTIIKKRVPKGYRIKGIDQNLRKIRTKQEARLLIESKKCNIKIPIIFDIDLENYAIIMEKINGDSVKKILNNSNNNTQKNISKIIGRSIARLHNCNIIHGDLTTSNILYDNNEIVLIDFGLGKFSDLDEDKGVDLLVLKKSLISTHYKISKACFQYIINEYMNITKKSNILEKIEEIESRARYI